MRYRIRRGPIWTLTTDAGFQMIAALVLMVTSYSESLDDAATEAAKVPLMEVTITGLEMKKGDLEEYIVLVELERDGLAEQGEELAGTIEELERKLGDQGQRIGQLTEEMARLQPGGPVDVVFIVDCTKSMDPHHEQLKKALVSLFRWTPRISSECRIGVLGVRDGIVYRYPLQVIHPPVKDGGQSQSELLNFMASMKTASAMIDHKPAIEEAFRMLPEKGRNDRRQVIFMLSDVGQSERDGKVGYSTREWEEATAIVNDVKSWASKGERSVGSIYVGNGNATSQERQWFQHLAQPSGQNFASESAEMFDVIFRAIEQKKGT